MQKPLSVLMAFAFALSLATVALAETKAEPMKAAPAMKTEAKKAKSHQITGIVEAVDTAAGTLTVKGKKQSVSLKASDEVKLAKIHVGEKVLVHYRGDTAYSLKKVSARKTAKKEMTPASSAPKPAGM